MAHTKPITWIAQHLAWRGYLQGERWKAALESGAQALEGMAQEITDAVGAYQAFHGLEAHGEVCEETADHMEEPRCAMPDWLGDSVDLCRWKDSHIRWFIDLSEGWPGIGAVKAADAFTWAWTQWASVSGLQPLRVDKAADAHVVTALGDIDGLGRVLAWSEMPADGIAQRKQTFDRKEMWGVGDSLPVYLIDLKRVACHEIGHVLGCPHLPAGSLMSPQYSRTVATPQQYDINEMIARYPKV